MATYLHSPDAAARIDFDGFSIILHVEQRAIISSSSEWADCVISATPRAAVNASCLADYRQTHTVCARAFCAIFVFSQCNPRHTQVSKRTGAAAAVSGSTNWLILRG